MEKKINSEKSKKKIFGQLKQLRPLKPGNILPPRPRTFLDHGHVRGIIPHANVGDVFDHGHVVSVIPYAKCGDLFDDVHVGKAKMCLAYPSLFQSFSCLFIIFENKIGREFTNMGSKMHIYGASHLK